MLFFFPINMDVERIQKINKLALDLMKQGLATSREDAVIQAERTFRDQDASDYSSIRERMEVKKPETPTVANLAPDEIKNILEQNSAFLVKKIKEFQEKVESMEKEIESLKIKMYSARAPAPEPVSRGMEAAHSEKKENAPHPRSGSYKEGDVSIEKFFYMGNKK